MLFGGLACNLTALLASMKSATVYPRWFGGLLIAIAGPFVTTYGVFLLFDVRLLNEAPFLLYGIAVAVGSSGLWVLPIHNSAKIGVAIFYVRTFIFLVIWYIFSFLIGPC